MHDYFSHWLGGVTIGLTGDVAKSRWVAVEKLANWANQPHKVVQLSAIAAAGPSTAGTNPDELIRVLQSGDASFPMIENDVEVQVMSASAIAEILTGNDSIADIASLAISTGTFGNREPDLANGINQLSERYLLDRATNSRMLIRAESDAADWPSKFRTIKDLAAKTSSSHAELMEAQAVLAEEVNVLWWIFNGRSRTWEQSRSDLSAAQLLLASAGELADLIHSPVPPFAATEFLGHVLACARKPVPRVMKVTEAIDSAPRDWRQLISLSMPDVIPRTLLPLTSQMRESEQSPIESRADQLNASSGLSGEFEAPLVQLGLQFLRELLLIKTVRHT